MKNRVKKKSVIIITAVVVVLLILFYVVHLQVSSSKVINKVKGKDFFSLKEQLELDPILELDNLVGIHDDILYLREPLAREIKRYSLKEEEFLESIFFEVPTVHYLDYKIVADKIIIINHYKRLLNIYDINGKKERTIFLEVDDPTEPLINEIYINSVPIVLDNKHIYLSNRFLKEQLFINIQKYNMDSELICEVIDNVEVYHLIDYKNSIISIDKEIVTIFNKDLEKKSLIYLKDKYRNENETSWFAELSIYFVHDDMFYGINKDLEVHLTDFGDYYEIFKLNNILREKVNDLNELYASHQGNHFIIIDKNHNILYYFE